MSVNDRMVALSEEDLLKWEIALGIKKEVQKVECLIQLINYDDEGQRYTYNTIMMLDLDSSVEAQIFSQYPEAENFVWVETKELEGQ